MAALQPMGREDPSGGPRNVLPQVKDFFGKIMNCTKAKNVL